jgi:hypothetical protein
MMLKQSQSMQVLLLVSCGNNEEWRMAFNPEEFQIVRGILDNRSLTAPYAAAQAYSRLTGVNMT